MMKNTTFIVGLTLLVVVVIWIALNVDNTTEVNKNTCAIYGYQEDCKTPLTEDYDKQILEGKVDGPLDPNYDLTGWACDINGNYIHLNN